MQSSAIDFSHYLPPGVYTNPSPGPQLAVNSTLPTAVGLIGQTVGYRSFIQTVQVNPDAGVSPSPTVTIVTTVPGVAAANDVQLVTINGTPSGGTFTLSFGGQTTSNLAYNATASAVQTAVQAMSSVGSGNATVSGANGGPYTITFNGSLASAPQTLITASGSGLTGGTSPTVTVSHSTTGATAVNEQQTVTITGTLPDTGGYTLTYSGQTTTQLSYTGSAATVQAALQALSNIGNGNATVSGSAGGPYTVTFTGSLAATNVAALTATDSTPVLIPSPSQTLAQQGITVSTVVVTNPNSGQTYVLNTDYTIINVGGTNGTSDALYALERVPGGHILPGDYVQVQYQYTDPTYYTPYIFYDYNDVKNAYGEPFNVSTGTVQSELTLLAKFAFLNGAYQVVCTAVKSSTTPGNATIGDYGTALDTLRDQALIAVIAVGTGQQPLHQLIQEHVDQQSANRFERRAIVAVDSTTTIVPSSQRIIDAQEITDQRIMMVSPGSFNYFSPELNKSIVLGGQYMAASLAGLTVSMSFAMPLTRKTITGWTGVAEFEQEGQKNLESQNGLCVIEKTRRQLMQVRHGVTTNPTDLLSREWSIIGQQDAMVYRLRDYLESDNLIGQPIYPFTLINVKGSAEAALQSLIRDGLIVDYTGLKVRQLATNPDVLEVSYTWLPAFPLNYIVVTFNVSLTTGNVTSNSGSSANSSNSTSTAQTRDVGVPTSSIINDFGGTSNTLQST